MASAATNLEDRQCSCLLVVAKRHCYEAVEARCACVAQAAAADPEKFRPQEYLPICPEGRNHLHDACVQLLCAHA